MTAGNPRPIGRGDCWDSPGTFWAWPVDGYWDVHHAPDGQDPDGSDVVSEFHPTLADARRWVREIQDPNLLVSALTGGPR